MTNESNHPETTAIVEVDPNATALTETGTTGETEEVKQETQALIDALRKRAQYDAQSAGDFTRETYLKAVRQLRETVEQNKLFDPDEVEKAFETMQAEAEKNWHLIVKEATDFGDRLSEAAKAAWDIITQPKSDTPPRD